jgi:hypothetical protein
MATAIEVLAIAALVAFVTGPVLVLLHELGHAVVPLFRTDRPVRVWLGSPPYLCEFHLGRLTLSIAARSTIFGWCQWEGQLNRAEFVAAILLGPIVSAACCGLLYAIASHVGGFIHHVLIASAVFAACQALFTALPLHYPVWLGQYSQMPSDGMVALRALRDGKADD